jgi:site-specific recombinase XerD
MVISLSTKEIVMLEHYYVRPVTIDRIRSSWIAPAIEKYVGWLEERRHASKTVSRRIPLLVTFGEFAKARGATELAQLPQHVELFVETWLSQRVRGRRVTEKHKKACAVVRNAVQQMLSLVVPGYVGAGRRHRPLNPFEAQAPRFISYLTEEKGLRANSLEHYRSYLGQFAAYLVRMGLKELAHLSPRVLSGFIAEYGARVSWTSLRDACGTLRVFVRYLHREGVLAKDFSSVIEFPQSYRLSGIPRSITWDQVEQVLSGIDRRAACGKRDYAMLLLLATYGLRGCEVATLTLDDIDWGNDRLRIRERKAGNSTTYPLSSVVGTAIVDYLKNGRPTSNDRAVFLRAMAPLVPISPAAVATRAGYYIRQAGITVPRPGSHTLRHSCVQRLINANFSLKDIGGYVGHRNTRSTQIYGKVAIETLRQVALGDGEGVL